MHILLATGIYPPEIGGPATYAACLAEALVKLGHTVTIVTYCGTGNIAVEIERLDVVPVSRIGNVFSRWLRFKRALRFHGQAADAVIAFSSVSTGIPLMLSGLKKPKKILRLGGDFFWERYTDAGGMKSLREWYASSFGFWRMMNFTFMTAILRSFQHIVYSTKFQQLIHEKEYAGLPKSSVIENARPTCAPAGASTLRLLASGDRSVGRPHQPFRLLFMGRFVGFKNLPALIEAVSSIPNVTLTLVGAGPVEKSLRAHAAALGIGSRIRFCSPVSAQEKIRVFREHDLLVLPSVTEISPNTALEAVSEGLPVLLTQETGLKETACIRLRPLRTAAQIAHAIRECIEHYDFSQDNSEVRTYATLAQDWVQLLSSL